MTGKRPPRLSRTELDLFERAMDGVAPLEPRHGRRGRRGPRAAAPPPDAEMAAPSPPAIAPATPAAGRQMAGGQAAGGQAAGKPAPAAPALPPLSPHRAPGLDRRMAERLRRGQIEVEATLDLHGMTLAEAERSLAGFLARAQAGGKRCVLVVTGKGLRPRPLTPGPEEDMPGRPGREERDRGGIRREFPHWLNQPRNRMRVHAFRAAHLRHGGSGAFYVLLRKPQAGR